MNPTVALISLGANLGDRRGTLESALVEIARFAGAQLLKVSRFHETAPVGGPGGQLPYLNAAASFAVECTPELFAAGLGSLERRFGRTRIVRWDSRTLDLDLILFGNIEIFTPELELPHPRFALRSFVLEPLAEIAPSFVDPTTNLSIDQLSENLRRRPARASLLKAKGETGERFNELGDALTGIGWEVVESDAIVPTLFVAENLARVSSTASERWRGFVKNHATLPVDHSPAPVWWVDTERIEIDLANLLETCQGIVGL